MVQLPEPHGGQPGALLLQGSPSASAVPRHGARNGERRRARRWTDMQSGAGAVAPLQTSRDDRNAIDGVGMSIAAEPDDAKIKQLESELDPEMRFRPLLPAASWIVAALLFGLSCFHYYTAGFGLLQETLHRGVHIACVLGLIFLVFSWSRKGNAVPQKASALAPLGIGIIDWLCAIAAVITS